jgi:hypothetical protein
MTQPTITISKTTPMDLRAMSEAMSEDSKDTAIRTGYTPLKLLWYSYRRSLMCRTAFIDGKLAAIWGIYGKVFSGIGQPWLIMTPETEEYPMRVAFRYRKELRKFQEMFPILEDYVDETNEKSLRMLELMGFKISKNLTQLGDVKMRRAERRV